MKASEIWKTIDIKLIAILRGITPREAEAMVTVLLEAGFRVIEIPLNSPSPFESIKIASEVAKQKSYTSCLVGAGTVLSPADVEAVHAAGGNLIVSPNVNADVIAQTKELEMLSAPGVFTPSECLSALNAGADLLKIFPASNLGAGGVKALRAVLPNTIELCAVGGVGNDNFQYYLDAGVTSFGLGSSLYKPGMSAQELRENAKSAVENFKACVIK